jgi:hypothetical protein
VVVHLDQEADHVGVAVVEVVIVIVHFEMIEHFEMINQDQSHQVNNNHHCLNKPVNIKTMNNNRNNSSNNQDHIVVVQDKDPVAVNIADHMEIQLVVHVVAVVITDLMSIIIHLILTIQPIFPLFQNNKIEQCILFFR